MRINFFIAFIIFAINLFAREPFLAQNGDKKFFCSYSAKNLKDFYKTSVIINLEDGTIMQYCSIGEMAMDSMIEDVVLSSASVFDYFSGEMIKAKNAFFVVGMDGEFAFKNENDAKNFAFKYKARVVDFDLAYEVGFLRVKKNTELNHFKNIKRNYKIGEKIYKNLCQEISKKDYRFINELKSDIFKKCKNIDDKKADYVTNFLWNYSSKTDSKIVVPSSAKCPICGMFVYKYPRWATYLKLENREYFFDGVKDMMKFLYENLDENLNKNIEIFVSDYYSQNKIDARNAFYVFGSDVFGPMGNELIPFENLKDANIFKLEHKGLKIYKFSEISKSVLCRLESKEC
ncbi:hypothetical protein F1B92_04905 [Campylobacter sp. FMV-PI01]|uniref:NosL family protein n=1 Tax=Campylobacter portucalensis TaxID=2608384 RepID=A0A6L5WJ67_9BACT|nr:nitrous oxide reductase accessory protein NosL [Campylobacter portucalensis]MSN96512.1 hypothetical protein [Campylobacter portucalensis]